MQEEITNLTASLEKTKTELTKLKVHMLRIEKSTLINIATDQKRNNLQIKNLIDAELMCSDDATDQKQTKSGKVTKQKQKEKQLTKVFQ